VNANLPSVFALRRLSLRVKRRNRAFHRPGDQSWIGGIGALLAGTGGAAAEGGSVGVNAGGGASIGKGGGAIAALGGGSDRIAGTSAGFSSTLCGGFASCVAKFGGRGRGGFAAIGGCT
jgi:hypothetical protein